MGSPFTEPSWVLSPTWRPPTRLGATEKPMMKVTAVPKITNHQMAAVRRPPRKNLSIEGELLGGSEGFPMRSNDSRTLASDPDREQGRRRTSLEDARDLSCHIFVDPRSGSGMVGASDGLFSLNAREPRKRCPRRPLVKTRRP